jgi:Heat induced stress protein YflT domain
MSAPAAGAELTVSRRTIATVTSYEEAERVVDRLSDEHFPVEHVTIVGTGLRYLEQVQGRMTNGRATLLGAAAGIVLGLFWGLLFGAFFTVDSAFFGVLLYGMLVGVVFGALIGLISHTVQRGRRDFESISTTRAERYELQVDDAFADRAEQLLARTPASR